MGQRLNIEIKNRGHLLANAYYHWSGYTGTAVCLTMIVLSKISEDETLRSKCRDTREYAIRLLEETSAGINVKEREEIKKFPRLKRYKIQDAVSRNRGLIAITESGMQETRKYEEARVTIDIGTQKVSFGACWYMPKDEYVENFDKDEEEYAALPEYDFKPDMTFKKFSAFAEQYQKWYEEQPYAIRLPDGNVIGWIE